MGIRLPAAKPASGTTTDSITTNDKDWIESRSEQEKYVALEDSVNDGSFHHSTIGTKDNVQRILEDRIADGAVHDGDLEGSFEGPYNESESEHYNHEHFHHPQGLHHEPGESDYSQEHEYHDEVKEHQGQPHGSQGQGSLPTTTLLQQVNPAHMDRAKKMMAAAEARARDILEKERLLAEKLALEAKERELEGRLRAHEQELEQHRRLQLQDSESQE
jgi:hypothetical protein